MRRGSMTTRLEKHRPRARVRPFHTAAEVEQVTKAMEEYSLKRLQYTAEEAKHVGKMVREVMTDPYCE
jgi:hypothetical protein